MADRELTDEQREDLGRGMAGVAILLSAQIETLLRILNRPSPARRRP